MRDAAGHEHKGKGPGGGQFTGSGSGGTATAESERIFYIPTGSRKVEVIKNPTNTEYQQMADEVRREFPNMPRGEGKLRSTRDADGNVYTWKAHEGTHFMVEAELSDQLGGTELNQNQPEKKTKHFDYDPDKPLAIDTPEFKAWFGESKVVDEGGKPLVVYHGTSFEFDEFETERTRGNTTDPNAFIGSHFSSSPDTASRFAEGLYVHGLYSDEVELGGNVVPVHLSIKRPLMIGLGRPDPAELKSLEEAYERARSEMDSHAVARITSQHDEFSAAMAAEDEDKLQRLLDDPAGDELYRKQQAALGAIRKLHEANRPIKESEIYEAVGMDYDEVSRKLTERTGKARERYASKIGKQLREKLIDKGYDGVLYENAVEDETGIGAGDEKRRTWIALHPEQIKSATGNSGTFDPKNKRITMAVDSRGVIDLDTLVIDLDVPRRCPAVIDLDRPRRLAIIDLDLPQRMAAVHAPAGYTERNPLMIGGKPYVGGEFIPGAVVAKATSAERAAIEGNKKPAPKSEFTGEEADEMFRRVVETGGFTYQPITDKTPSSGFAVSRFLDRGVVIDADDLTEDDIIEFYNANADLFKNPAIHMGGWWDSDTGKVYLDLSELADTPEQAEKICFDFNQKGYYDLAAGQTVVVQARASDEFDTEPTGERQAGGREGVGEGGYGEDQGEGIAATGATLDRIYGAKVKKPSKPKLGHEALDAIAAMKGIPTEAERKKIHKLLHPKTAKERAAARKVIEDGKATLFELMDDNREPSVVARMPEYKAAMSAAIDRMTPTMVQRLSKTVKMIHLHPSTESITSFVLREHGFFTNGQIGGFFDQTGYGRDGGGELTANGGYKADEQPMNGSPGDAIGIYTHELGHAIDCTKHSVTDDWQDAWLDEISIPRRSLTEYAATSAQEGFAEYFRLICEDRERAEKDFPMCWAHFKNTGFV